jgi:hypothetical protein
MSGFVPIVVSAATAASTLPENEPSRKRSHPENAYPGGLFVGGFDGGGGGGGC